MAPSKAANDAIGAIGGAVLAACLTPQLVRLYRTQSARDISYGYLALYTSGLTLSFLYLYFEGATVAWICMLIETVFVLVVGGAKVYLDNWGPYSERGAAAKAAALARQLSEGSGGPGRGDSDRDTIDAEGGGPPGGGPAVGGSTAQQRGAPAGVAGALQAERVRQRGQHA